MIHSRLDLNHWVQTFPLDTLRSMAANFVEERRAAFPREYSDQNAVGTHVSIMSPGGERITGPYDIAVVEQLRAEAFSVSRPDHAVPTDVFIFNRGEPPHRKVTKIGGLPYRSARKSWPSLNGTRHLTFVGQFCFADSHDIIGELPGDILLIFADEESLWETEGTGLHTEWITAEITELVRAEDIPRTDWHIQPCFGTIHRTFDYPGVETQSLNYNSPCLVPVLEGTKIGGVPRWIQSPVDLPGRFLCALGSIDPKPYSMRPFPFINVPEPATSDGDAYLMWGDVGSLYLSVDSIGTIFSTLQYY